MWVLARAEQKSGACCVWMGVSRRGIISQDVRDSTFLCGDSSMKATRYAYRLYNVTPSMSYSVQYANVRFVRVLTTD